MTTELLTSRVFSVKLHGEEKQVKKGFNIDLTMRVPLEGVAECRWYDTGNFRLVLPLSVSLDLFLCRTYLKEYG